MLLRHLVLFAVSGRRQQGPGFKRRGRCCCCCFFCRWWGGRRWVFTRLASHKIQHVAPSTAKHPVKIISDDVFFDVDHQAVNGIQRHFRRGRLVIELYLEQGVESFGGGLGREAVAVGKQTQKVREQMIKQKVIEHFIQGQREKQNIARNWERGKTVHSRAFPVVGDDDGIKGPDLFPTRVHRPTVALLSQTTGRRHPAVGHGWGVQLTGHVVRDRPHAAAVAADVILGGGGSRASDNARVVPSLRDAGVGPGLKLCLEGRGGGGGGGGGGGRSRRRWVFGPCDELNSVVDRGRERIVVRV
jgi:hypothetical protein